MPSRQSKAIWKWLSVICHGSWPNRVISFRTIFICQFTNLVGSVIFSLSNIEQKSELQSNNIPTLPVPPALRPKIRIYLFLFSSSGQEMFGFIQLIFRLVSIQTLSQGMCTWLTQTPVKQSILTIRWIRTWKGDKTFLNTWLWNQQMLTCLTHSKWTVKWIPWPNFP